RLADIGRQGDWYGCPAAVGHARDRNHVLGAGVVRGSRLGDPAAARGLLDELTSASPACASTGLRTSPLDRGQLLRLSPKVRDVHDHEYGADRDGQPPATPVAHSQADGEDQGEQEAEQRATAL